MPNTRLTRAIALLLATLPTLVWAAPARIVAIGDVHGAYEQLLGILRTTDLIDAEGNWSGGSTSLVQTGDVTDRGTYVRDVLELLMKLERQAASGEGRVHVLLGNHEAMNLIANDRDALINPEIFARFVSADSEERQEAAAKAWVKWRRSRVQAQERADPGGTVALSADLSAVMAEDGAAWRATHPPGLIEYLEAFGPEGELGRWLRGLPVAITLGDTLFIHGGIGPQMSAVALDEINDLHRRRIAEWDAERQRLEKRRLILPFFSWLETRAALEHHLYFPASTADRQLAAAAWNKMNTIVDELFAADSPLWYRGYALPPLGLTDQPLADLLNSTDATHGVRRTVVGHTPLADHSVLDRLDGRLFLIDTGMLTSYYGGRASALEIHAGSVTPVYAGVESQPASQPDAVEPAEAQPARVFHGADGTPLPFQRPGDIESFLREATVVSTKPVGQGKTGALKVLLERDGIRAHAVFHTIDERRGSATRPVRLDDGTSIMFFRDSFRGQVAAYELSKLLGMDNVPPAVVREVEGSTGSAVLWIENGIDLFGWREREDSDPSDPRLHRQMHDMRVFDNLIDNTDRNSQNIFWNGDFDLWLIDHTRSLSQNRKLLRPDRLTRCSRPLLEALERLDPDQVRQRLEPHLNRFEIKSLLERRDKVVEEIRENIRKQGEDKVLFDHGSGPKITISEHDG